MSFDTTPGAESNAADTADDACVITTFNLRDRPNLEDDILRSSAKQTSCNSTRARSKRMMPTCQGSASSEPRRWSDKDDAATVSRRRNTAINKVSPHGLASQQSLHLQQMMNKFLETHFPRGPMKNFTAGIQDTWLTSLMQRDDTIKSPLARHAVAVVCMARVGNRSNDTRLRIATHQQYAGVIHFLRREMTQSVHSLPRWIPMFCILLLAMADDVSSYGTTMQMDWVTHYEGAFAYLQALGPTRFSGEDPKERQLIMNTFEPSHFIGLARRKPCFLARPEWTHHIIRRVVPSMGPVKDCSSRMTEGRWQFRLANYKISAILERVEDATTSPSAHRKLINICIDIEQLIEEIRQFAIKAGYSPDTIYDNLIHLSEHEKFDPLREEDVFITCNTTFKSFFATASVTKTFRDADVWMNELILECALLRIYHFHPEVAFHGGSDARPQVHRDAFSNASNLCRSIYCITHEAESQALCSTADLYILLAQNYFENAGYVQELGWCQGARLAIRLHLDRLQATQPPTLCRIPDLVETVGSVTAYRSLTQAKLCPFAG